MPPITDSINVNRDLMYGGRITSEEKSAISTYVGAGIAIVLAVVGVYFFFLTQKEKKETTTFDPNRPIPSDNVLKSRLKAEEYDVVRGNGAQTPFKNEFWNNEKIGIYVDVITGEPLFASVDKFDGKVGLPTFTKPISKDALVEVPDNSNEMRRTQVRAKRSNARRSSLNKNTSSIDLEKEARIIVVTVLSCCDALRLLYASILSRFTLFSGNRRRGSRRTAR